MTNFSTTKTLTFVLLLSLFSVANLTYAAKSDCSEILKRMVVQYGGVSALEKLNRPYWQQWQLIAMTSNEKGTDQRSINLPNKLTVELTYPSRSEKRILDGNVGGKIFNKTQHVSVHGPGLNAMKLQRMRLYNPLLLLQRATEIDVNELNNHHYLLTLHEGSLTTDYYVNRQTLLIDKVIGTLNMNGSTMSFLTEYNDYKSVEGVMLPHQEIKYAGNVNTAVLTLKETQFEKY